MAGPNDETTGLGTELWLKPPGGTLTKAALVTMVPELPTGTRALLSSTNMDTDGFKTYWKAPLADGNEFTVTVNWVDGSATDDLMADCEAADGSVEYRIVTQNADGTTYKKRDGTAVVLSYQINNPMNETRTGTITIKPTSAVTVASYTPA